MPRCARDAIREVLPLGLGFQSARPAQQAMPCASQGDIPSSRSIFTSRYHPIGLMALILERLPAPACARSPSMEAHRFARPLTGPDCGRIKGRKHQRYSSPLDLLNGHYLTQLGVRFQPQ